MPMLDVARRVRVGGGVLRGRRAFWIRSVIVIRRAVEGVILAVLWGVMVGLPLGRPSLHLLRRRGHHHPTTSTASQASPPSKKPSSK